MSPSSQVAIYLMSPSTSCRHLLRSPSSQVAISSGRHPLKSPPPLSSSPSSSRHHHLMSSSSLLPTHLHHHINTVSSPFHYHHIINVSSPFLISHILIPIFTYPYPHPHRSTPPLSSFFISCCPDSSFHHLLQSPFPPPNQQHLTLNLDIFILFLLFTYSSSLNFYS